MQELATALEELRVSEEAMHAQHEELALALAAGAGRAGLLGRLAPT